MATAVLAAGRRGLALCAGTVALRAAGQGTPAHRALRLGAGLAALAAGTAQGRRWLLVAEGPAEPRGAAAREAAEEASAAAEAKTLARLYEHRASWWRLARLLLNLLPLGLLWPLWLVNPAAFWVLVAAQLERCGPCFVKLSQWLATRRDIFPDTICIAFGRLHEQVVAHWSSGVQSEEVLERLRADQVPLRSLEPRPRASGSIAEVFFGELEDGTAVAVKCLRPGIRRIIEADLAWLLRLGSLSDHHHVLRMYGLRRAAELFCQQVEMQTDFQVEADNLRRFRANFTDENEVICFPEPLFTSSDFLVLTRENGEELSRIFREADAAVGAAARRGAAAALPNSPAAPAAAAAGEGAKSITAEVRAESLRRHLGISQEVSGEIAVECIACYMRMLFKDNFVHGDLHPGNVLLRLRSEGGGSGGSSSSSSRRAAAGAAPAPSQQGAGAAPPVHGEGEGLLGLLPSRLRRFVAARRRRPRAFELVVLDAGLAVPLPPAKVEALRRITVAILYADYEKASRLVLEESPDASTCERPEEFKRELARVFCGARRDAWDQGFLQLSEAGLECLQLVRRHHVHLDTTLSWAILALLSVEGAARQLDPHVDATGAATRYIITARNLVQELFLGSWVTGKEMLVQLALERCGLDFWAFRNWRLRRWNEETHGAAGQVVPAPA